MSSVIELIVKHEDGRLSRHRLRTGQYVVGAEPGSSIQLSAEGVAERHAQITVQDGQVMVENLDNQTGTFVDGDKVEGPTTISRGQEVRVASTTLRIARVADELISAAPDVVRKGLHDREYRVEELIARGGMGQVFSARDQHIRRSVAMKVLPDDSQGDESDFYRFIEEAQITGQLQHPNIVPVYALGLDDQEQPYYTMKFVKGQTLEQVLDRLAEGDSEAVSEYPLHRLLTIFQKICDAVAYAHARGVIHRDLKPANVMMGDYGEVLVMDWGLAKVKGADDSETIDRPSEKVQSVRSDAADTHRTVHGAVIGTPNYMAPEQGLGKSAAIDERTDIFALGGLLFQILSLRPPRSGKTLIETLKQVTAGTIADPYQLQQDGKLDVACLHCPGGRIPRALSAVAMKALERDPDARYQTVKQFQAEVDAFQRGYATSAEEAGIGTLIKLWMMRHRAEAALVAAALAILIVVVSGFLIKVTHQRNRAEALVNELRGTAPAFANQARLCMQENDSDGALSNTDYAVSLEPESPDYHALRGNVLQVLLRFDEAAQAYGQALQRDPTWPYAEANVVRCRELIASGTHNAMTDQEIFRLQAMMASQGRLDDALTLVRRHKGGEQGPYWFWKDHLRREGFDVSTMHENRLQMDPRGIIQLDLSELDESDLDPLNGMPIYDLNISRTPVQRLDILAKLPLLSLRASYTQISDLTPLLGLPLTYLNVSHTQARDLAPLRGMKLESLNISGTPIEDLQALEGMDLAFLMAYDSKVSDIGPLAGKPLRALNLSRTQVNDLTPLTGMNLRELRISGTGVTSLEPLRGTAIAKLDLSECEALIDIRPLADCTSLEILVLPPNCRDIEFLRELPKLGRISYRVGGAKTRWRPAQTAKEFWEEHDEAAAH